MTETNVATTDLTKAEKRLILGRNGKDITGQRFGMWLVVCISNYKNKSGCVHWCCVCDCGKEAIVRGGHLRTGQSTGCLSCASKEHGLCYHPIYRIWIGIKARCLRKNEPGYSGYGGRGIKMSREWETSFMAFYNDMIDGYAKGLQIDRIDNNGNYCKGNCRWATPLVNSNNTRKSVFMTLNGKTQSMSQWSKELGIPRSTINHRKKVLMFPDYECLKK